MVVYSRSMTQRVEREYTTAEAASLLGMRPRTVVDKAYRLGLGRVIAGIRLLRQRDLDRLAQDGRALRGRR